LGLAATDAAAGNIVSNATIKTIETLAQTVCPALSNTPPYGNITLDTRGFTNTLANLVTTYLGNGSTAKFVQAFNQAEVFINQTNEFLESVNVGNVNLGPSFTNMNDLATGGISKICTDPKLLGADLANLGQLINLDDLENWGTPLAFVKQLVNLVQVVPPPLQIAFTVLGIDPDLVEEMVDPEVHVDAKTQQIMFAAMSTVRNDSLKQIMKVCKITNLNGIETVADLLNPVKILPRSYQTLQVPTNQGFLPVYTGQTINPTVIPSLPGYASRKSDVGYQMTSTDTMSLVTVDQYAYGNKALALALLQINGVISMTLPELADMLKNMEIIDQPLINDLKTPLTPDLVNYFNTLYPQGTGPGNTIVISDLFGLAAGYNVKEPMQRIVANLANVNTNAYSNICEAMSRVASSEFGPGPVTIPNRFPANGVYPTQDAALDKLIGLANTEIANINAMSLKELTNVNVNWNTVGNQYIRETTMHDEANITFSAFRKKDRPAIMAFCRELTNHGLDTTPGGYRDFLRAIADRSIRPGQAVIAAMTQGSNEYHLSRAGVFANMGITVPFKKNA
jgi:hypothetical protein